MIKTFSCLSQFKIVSRHSTLISDMLGRNMYDVDELIDACKLGAKRLQLPSIAYDTEHPLVGSAMKPVTLALKQMRNNRCKLERRADKIKLRKFRLLLCGFRCSCSVSIANNAPMSKR